MIFHFRRRFAAVFVVLCAALLLSGCGQSAGIYRNYRAVEDLQIVQTLGIDLEPDGLITVTAAAAKAGDSAAPAVLSRSAKSLPEALAALQEFSQRGQLFFAHIQYLLLGQAAAEYGLEPVFDYVERDIHTRMGTDLFLIRDSSAKELMSALADGEKISELLASVKRDTELQGGSRVDSLRAAAVALGEYGAAAVCALRLTDGSDGILSDPPVLTALPDGYGILRDGSLVCFLDGEDAEILGLLTGTGGTLRRSVSDGEGCTVTLELSGGADFSMESPSRLKAAVHADAAIAAVTAAGAQITDPETLQRLADALAAELNTSAERVLSLSKTLDADFLPLAPVLRRHTDHPLPADWLQELEFQVETEVTPTHSYDLSDPPDMEETK